LLLIKPRAMPVRPH